MKSVNAYVCGKMKFRKIMMIIFSACSIILICGILNNSIENDKISDFSYDSDGGSETQISIRKLSPRETVMDRKDRNIRLYSAIILAAVMAGTFAADFLFVRCPVCSKHITFSISPEFCKKCGTNFARKENER